MGLQFGLGQGECLAAVRQRRAIKLAPLSPLACSAVRLVLSDNLPANIKLNKQMPCDSFWDMRCLFVHIYLTSFTCTLHQKTGTFLRQYILLLKALQMLIVLLVCYLFLSI